MNDAPEGWESVFPEPYTACPCCGGAAAMKVHRSQIAIRCNGCGLATQAMPTLLDAVCVWNRRQPAPPVPEVEGSFPLVLYFKERIDLEECVAQVLAAKGNHLEILVP